MAVSYHCNPEATASARPHNAAGTIFYTCLSISVGHEAGARALCLHLSLQPFICPPVALLLPSFGPVLALLLPKRDIALSS